jgi:hypothetical protein
MEPPDDPRWKRLAAHPGLCRDCRHGRLLSSASSVFLRCALSDLDPRFRRYPELPVLVCRGFAPVPRGR